MTKKEVLIGILFLFVLAILPCINAAEIYGTVYDMSLNPANDAVIEVDSVPKQTKILKDGTYSFTLPIGDYIIKATYVSNYNVYSTEENITIVDEGRYIVDLIVFPDLSEESELLLLGEDINLEDIYEEEEQAFPWLYIVLVVVIIAVIFLFFKKRKPMEKTQEKILEEEIDPKDKIYEFIKQKGGRVTQREIRKNFPVSQATISLILTELENDGKLKKIKRGKGNIIILQK
jgi:uncharacterized membrane protein